MSESRFRQRTPRGQSPIRRRSITVLEAVRHVITSAIAGLRKETDVLQTLHAESEAALRRLRQRHPALNETLRRAAGYVVFPSIGKAALLLGAAFGMGEV